MIDRKLSCAILVKNGLNLLDIRLYSVRWTHSLLKIKNIVVTKNCILCQLFAHIMMSERYVHNYIGQGHRVCKQTNYNENYTEASCWRKLFEISPCAALSSKWATRFTHFHPLSVHGWTLAFLLAVHRLCGAIEWRLSHFLPHWLRTGLAECGQLGKNPLKYSTIAGNWTRATERTDSEIHSPTELPDYYSVIQLWVVRASDNWANIVTGWTPAGIRKRGRPKTRWVDDIRALNNNWMSSAQDKMKWSDQKEASI